MLAAKNRRVRPMNTTSNTGHLDSHDPAVEYEPEHEHGAEHESGAQPRPFRLAQMRAVPVRRARKALVAQEVRQVVVDEGAPWHASTIAPPNPSGASRIHKEFIKSHARSQRAR